MKPPGFWQRDGVEAKLLAPLGFAIAGAGALQRRLTQQVHATVPVICVGNLTTGGTGKTPTVLALGTIATSLGRRVACLSRGYGGRLAGPVLVDPGVHQAIDVGDEPLLLAAQHPTVVARDRVVGCAVAIDQGADLVLLDDGFQNPRLAYDRAIVVIDGGAGFGNGHLVPAGPLREPVAGGLARADAVILVGADRTGVLPLPFHGPVFQADLEPDPADWAGKRVIAFAGIGRPQKFFDTLDRLAAVTVAAHGYADHHRYTGAELDRLARDAADAGATLVTTAKDAVRLPPAFAATVGVVRVRLAFADPVSVTQFLAEACS